MGQVICIASQKGGTGKTTTAVNIAASLALFNKNTLVLDCDPLGNASTALGINKAVISGGMFTALTGTTSFFDVILKTELPQLSVIPADYNPLFIESREATAIGSGSRLRNFIAFATGIFDYIIIDSPPSLGVLTTYGLCVSDFLIIPIQRRIFSFEGMNQLLSLIQRVRSQLNPRLKIAGILFTMIEEEWRHAYETSVPGFLSGLEKWLFKTTIPWDTTVADASDFGKPGVLYNIGAPGPDAYLRLSEEMHLKLSTFI